MPDEILKVPECAQLLKNGEKNAYTVAQRNQLPTFKVHGLPGFKPVDIDRLIEQEIKASPDEVRS